MKSVVFKIVVLAVCLLLLGAGFAWINFQPPAGPGFSTHRFRDAAGRVHRYALFLPFKSSAELEPKMPVIVFLNGGGENGNDGVAQISNNFGQPVWEMRGRFPFIGIAPQMPKDSQWTDPRSPTSRAAIEIINEVVRRYDGDPQRIYLTGPSLGGAGTYALAQQNPGYFAAIAPVSSGGYGPVARQLAQTPVWSFHNAGDSAVVDSARSTQRQLLEAGASPYFTEFAQGGHDSWTFAYRQPALYSWMLRQRRRAGDATPVKYTLLHAEDWQELADRGVQCVADEYRLRHHATAVPGLWIIPRDSDELHFEYRSAQAVPCELVVLNASGQTAEPWTDRIEIRIPWPEDGSASIRGGTLHDGATEDVPRVAMADTVAQRSLTSEGWNDIRLQVEGQRCTVVLNGWSLMTLHWDDPLATETRFGLRLAPLAENAEQEFRYLRVALRE